MTLQQLYKRFKKKEDCIKYLEHIIWNNSPHCPYCPSKRFTPMPKEQRYHCNYCKCSYSVTTKTIFHKTKIDLQKWFAAIPLIIGSNISARQLSKDIGVTKNTACFMSTRIKIARKEHPELINDLLYLK